MIGRLRASHHRAQDAIGLSLALLSTHKEAKRAAYQTKLAIAAELIKQMRAADYGVQSRPPQVTLH